MDSWGDRFGGVRDLTLTEEDNKEYLWLTDQYSGEVIKTSIDGKTKLSVQKPRINIYEEKSYSPTWVALVKKQ